MTNFNPPAVDWPDITRNSCQFGVNNSGNRKQEYPLSWKRMLAYITVSVNEDWDEQHCQ